MPDLPIPVTDTEVPARSSPEIVALDSEAPTFTELFQFMRDAELRFETLRLRYLDRTFGAAGERREIVEVWMRHPGRAKVLTRQEGTGVARDFDVWVTDGERVTTYDARANVRSIRPLPARVVGATEPDLPQFSRVYVPRTRLPLGSLAETFIHPHGFARNVLVTAKLSLLGSTWLVGDRRAFVLRADHPRVSHVYTDRPDHWLEVGIDRMTGIILRFVEGVGERVSRHAEVTDLALDESFPEEAFQLHVSSDVRLLY